MRSDSTAGTLILLLFLLTLASYPMQAQTYSVLDKFTMAKGGLSFAGLITDGMGHFLGTASMGGASNNGTVLELSSSGSRTVLHSFTGGTGGLAPSAGLLRDSAGNVYGTAQNGGDLSCSPPYGPPNYGCGIVFKIAAKGQFTVLHRFSGTPSDGAVPSDEGSLVRDAHGNLYGTTVYGGAYNYGALFKIDSRGHEAVIYSFGASSTDGLEPYAGLLLIGDYLYGTTEGGGTSGFGTVFKVSTEGKETVLHNFDHNEQAPNAPLVSDSAGNLYGTTPGGGANYQGTVFKLGPGGDETTLYSFSGGADGSEPAAGLTRDAAGNLYGTTWEGGSQTACSTGCGTVFKLSENGGKWTKTMLHDFQEKDGALPEGVLLLDKGCLYGTTLAGGTSTCQYTGNDVPGCGVAFKLVP